MKTVPILFTFDDKLTMPAGVCFTSLLENAGPDTFYDIFILHNERFDFSGTKLNELAAEHKNCRLTFRKVNDEFIGAYEVREIPETAYYRLISPELIPEYDKYLYSDVDVIFREDLGKYYDIDLEDNYFGAVDNCSSLRPGVREYLSKELKLDYRDGYYYSGNLVINAAMLLKDGMMDKFRELGRNHYLQQDMDIMNIACNKRFKPMNLSFCVSNYLYDMIVNRRKEMLAICSEEELNQALRTGIVHYNGAKPWAQPCLNMDIWWEYYRKSVFFDEKFCFDFWDRERNKLERLELMKRVKMLLRYPLDRKTWK